VSEAASGAEAAAEVAAAACEGNGKEYAERDAVCDVRICGVQAAEQNDVAAAAARSPRGETCDTADICRNADDA